VLVATARARLFPVFRDSEFSPSQVTVLNCPMARILIADDSPAARRALRRLLEEGGWEVCGEAQDGLEAVDKTATLRPDLIILGPGHAKK
jgi:PleD family two-component response regulator